MPSVTPSISLLSRRRCLQFGTSVGVLTALDVAMARSWEKAEPSQKAPGKPNTEAVELGLTVRVVGLRSGRGRVAVALFDNPKAFPKQERALQGGLAEISDGSATFSFSGLAPGRYAVAVLHDENGNNRMDFNWVGIPLEGYGFSRDAHALFGPPSFDEAAISLESTSRIWIKARYFRL
jgi:uncharacterized protein (DUF2141 family)